MSDIITCSKCGGSGKFIYKSGVTGHCYQCNGKGAVKRIAHKSFAISIMNNDGVRIDWLHINARSQSEAVRKARATAARGCYKDQLDTITATESGIEYTYKTISRRICPVNAKKTASGVFLHLRSFLLILAYSAKRQRHYLRSASVFPSSSTIFVTSAAIFSASSFVTLPVMFPAAS